MFNKIKKRFNNMAIKIKEPIYNTIGIDNKVSTINGTVSELTTDI